MREEEFKAWLAAGGATSEASRNTRTYAVRTIENNLASLDLPYKDLSGAWDADRFEGLRQMLLDLRDDFLHGGARFRVLMPDSKKPSKRLTSWRSWLGQYGRFLSGEPRGARDADRIRQYVLETYIEPARERDDEMVEVLARDVNDALGLNQGWANVCQALVGPKFLELAEVAPPEQIGVDQSPATKFRFHLDELPVLDEKARGEQPFVLFDASGAAFKPVRNFNRQSGRSAFRVKPTGATNKADESLEVETIAEVARAMLVDRLPARVQSVRGGPVNYLGYGKQKLVRYELDPAIAKQIGVPPQGGEATDVKGDSRSLSELGRQTEKHVSQPTNLIFYGPPGTGKTYITAAEAVRLCGEQPPDDRDELMAVYQRLLEAGRIEFVTFHQSISYEDFVEGLRPTQTSDDGAPGFELKAAQGVFRRIARRAETSTGPGGIHFSMQGRRVFKMSIGEVANPEDNQLFEDAIAGGYTILGFEDIDWSDDRFASRDAIIEAVRTDGVMGGDAPTGVSGRVQMPFIFRNWVNRGDIIVVSKGNSLFRAIGEVTGDYHFVPRQEPSYAHQRAVRWLWVDRAGVPVSEIYGRNFTQKSIYALADADLNLPALERYIASQQDSGAGAPEPFVLIIDEINRANISKVFGELITLLEPDKRTGQSNALRVRLPYSGDVFGVPSNLHILGTMNTADRSIALLDTALRRRFSFRELMPNPSLLDSVEGIDLGKLLAAINERIEYLFDRDHQIGHAYFMSCRSQADVDEVMRHKVIPLLCEYFYEDWAKVAAVLGDGNEADGDSEGRFVDRRRLKPPKGISNGDDSAPRYRWIVRESFSYDGFPA